MMDGVIYIDKQLLAALVFWQGGLSHDPALFFVMPLWVDQSSDAFL